MASSRSALRRTAFTLPLLLTFVVSASAQTAGIVKPAVLFNVVPPAPPPRAVSATTDDVVARLMSFDRNKDGTVQKKELLERMDGLVERGDTNHDGALDPAEIRQLAINAPGQFAVRGFEAGRYGFRDDMIQESSQLRIDDALDDLRLAGPTRAQADGIVQSFMNERQQDAAAVFIQKMAAVLAPEHVATLEAALNANSGLQTVGSGNRLRLNLFSGKRTLAQIEVPMSETARVAKAVTEYRLRLSLGDAERVALAEEMRGVLTDEQRDDFRAAMARRTIMKTAGASVSVLGDTPGLGRLALPQNGTAAQRQAEMAKSALDALLKVRQERDATAR
jgi:hypothetical protein